jgi:transposase
METEERRVAKRELVGHMLQGQPWHIAAAAAGLHVSRATEYRLLKRVRTEGETALTDGRHGHPTKVRAQVAQWLQAYWQAHPQASCREAQEALRGHQGVQVSQSQLSRVRAALGLTHAPQGPEKKAPTRATS